MLSTMRIPLKKELIGRDRGIGFVEVLQKNARPLISCSLRRWMLGIVHHELSIDRFRLHVLLFVVQIDYPDCEKSFRRLVAFRILLNNLLKIADSIIELITPLMQRGRLEKLFF